MFTHGVAWPKVVSCSQKSMAADDHQGEIQSDASESTEFPWILRVADVHAYDFFKVAHRQVYLFTHGMLDRLSKVLHGVFPI